MAAEPISIGVDTGGTFTDIVAIDAGRVRVAKVPSTPANPAQAVMDGLRQLVEPGTPVVLTYSTTVATNALLERRGANVLLFTTAGFEDLVEIGRQTRPDLYALEPVRPAPLVPRGERIGVRERMTFDGTVLTPLTARAIASAVRQARRRRPDAVAVCFLHSYINQAHERALTSALRRAGFLCTGSSDLGARDREYERFSTAVINAYVAPKMSRHLHELAARLRGSTVRVMQSNGGSIGAATAAREAVRTILSGPAAGVVGAAAVAAQAGMRRIITFDMGGTSTDVSLVDGAPHRTAEAEIGGLPINVPAVDVHTVGAGGGSIAYRDPGGALAVGPESAGADPGPACYGKGEKPTVTDANLILGRLGRGVLAGGLRLDRERGYRAVAALAAQLGLTVEDTAGGIVRVANAAMERAIRRVSVERGHDPRKYALVAFGGAAGAHACELADGLGIATVVSPRDPGVLSAWGAARADVTRDYVQTIRATRPAFADLSRVAGRLQRRARRDLVRDRVAGRSLRFEMSIAVRYAGQSHEIEVPLVRQYADRFHVAHEHLYGYADRARVVEVVHVGLRALAHRPRAAQRSPEPRAGESAPHRLRWRGRWVRARLFERGSLPSGGRISGPAVVTELSATTFIPPGWVAHLDRFGHLHLRHAR